MQGDSLSSRLLHYVITFIVLSGALIGTAYLSEGQVTHASHHVMPHTVSVQPRYLYAGVAQAGTTFKCQSLTATNRCYAPQQIRKAYDIQSVLDSGITGKGRSIVIIDAYQSPTIAQDLHTFDTTFGLADPTFNIVAPDGLTPFNQNDPIQTSWAGEISLDVEWSHAVAPDAAITLVLAKTSNDADLLGVTKYAIDHNLGDVISQSFGEAETCADPKILKQEHQVFQEATRKGISLFASAGDQGAAQPTCDGNSYFLSASTPASDPLVTAVGGTQLDADPTTGTYNKEVVWNEPQFTAAGGGGFSTLYQKPAYQFGTAGIKQFRGEPDVSYDAAINGGVLTVWSSSGQGANLVFIFGGTSAGSPQWAGITTLGIQKAHRRFGLINPAIYLLGHTGLYHSRFHDITVGNNSFTAQDANGNPVTVNGYSAGKGWDPASGWGTPDVAALLQLLPSATSATQKEVTALAD